MACRRLSVRAALVAVGALVSVLLMAGSASAATSTTLCVPTGENAPVKTPLKNGTCASSKTEKFTLTEFQNKLPLSDAEVKTLQGILPCIASVAKGIDEKPTVEFHGCNVQIVNGRGATETTNGAGNLVLGYDENPSNFPQTGSHDLVVGIHDEWTSYGGILQGFENGLNGKFAAVSGAAHSAARGDSSSVSGGVENIASGEYASVSGGLSNEAKGKEAWLSGGRENKATARWSSVSGGVLNSASGEYASVSGGFFNEASGERASASGGLGNEARGDDSSVSGGKDNHATNTGASVSGGKSDKAEGFFAWVGGGENNTAHGIESSVSGGANNIAVGRYSSISGGGNGEASGQGSSISGGKEAKASGLNSWIGGGFQNEVFSEGKAGEEGLLASIFGGKEEKTATDYAAIP
jgi:hypothetical protein